MFQELFTQFVEFQTLHRHLLQRKNMYLLHAPKGTLLFPSWKVFLRFVFFLKLPGCFKDAEHHEDTKIRNESEFFFVKPWDPGIFHGPQPNTLGRITKHPSFTSTNGPDLGPCCFKALGNQQQWVISPEARKVFFSKKKWWLLNMIRLIYFVVTPKIGVRWWPHVTFLKGFDSAFFGECSNPWVEVRWGDTSKSMQ